jgi:hypothetical protein
LADYLHHYVPATRFWDQDTHQDQLFSTSSVAYALGVGRTRLLQIPITPRIVLKKQKFFRKGDVLSWMEQDSLLGEAGLLPKLRQETLAARQRRRR